MRARPWILALVLAACGSPPAAPPSASPSPSLEPIASSSPAAAEPSGEPMALQAQLPSRLGGVELHTFAVGQDILERLAAQLGAPIVEIETAYASDHGARFLQSYAVRLAGTPADALALGWAATAYPPDVDDVVVTDELIAGLAVTVVHAPSAAQRLGTFYLHAQDETLFVVQTLDREVAAEVLATLP